MTPPRGRIIGAARFVASVPLREAKDARVVDHERAIELDAALVAACVRLKAAGVTLLNQSVLLRGVNDDAATLAELSEALFAAGFQAGRRIAVTAVDLMQSTLGREGAVYRRLARFPLSGNLRDDTT